MAAVEAAHLTAIASKGRIPLKNLRAVQATMQRIANRLNKVKHPANAKAANMPIAAAHSLLSAVAEECGLLHGKAMAIFNCGSGSLAAGAGLLEPQSMVVMLDALPDPILPANVREFKVACDLVLGGRACFADGCFDVAVVGPPPFKAKGLCLTETQSATRLARVTYALHKAEFMGLLEQAFPGIEIV